MGETDIEWTARRDRDGNVLKGFTFNPWHGCSKVSPGCKNCYAETLTNRFNPGYWGPNAKRRFFGDHHWNDPVRYNKKAAKLGERLAVFCASMSDVFEDREDLVEPRARLWRLIKATPNLDWLLLTKRPENLKSMLPWMKGTECGRDYITDVKVKSCLHDPWDNVWVGTSAENQEYADIRLPLLKDIRAKVRFVSYEPALEAVDFTEHISSGPRIDWIIAGSESGPGARPGDMAWYAHVRDQCALHNVDYFLKQHVVNGRKISLPVLDGRIHNAVPGCS